MAAYRSGELTLFAPQDDASVSPFLSAMKLDTASARGRTPLDALLPGREPGASWPDREFSPNAAREAKPV